MLSPFLAFFTFPHIYQGDGVEEAFLSTERVMTCSFHKSGAFFPGTGLRSDQGKGKGKGYAVNVPLHTGLTDDSFKSIFEPVCCILYYRFAYQLFSEGCFKNSGGISTCRGCPAMWCRFAFWR